MPWALKDAHGPVAVYGVPYLEPDAVRDDLPQNPPAEGTGGEVPRGHAGVLGDPTPDQAFARWGMLTARELAFLCGEDAKPPSDAVAYDWGDGVVYFSAAEAKARELATVPA